MLRTLNALMPAESPESSQLISFLIRAAKRMDRTSATIWHARISEVYGDLSGQRSFDRDADTKHYLDRHPDATPFEIIIALQTYFAFICDVLAISHLTGDSAHPTINLTTAGDAAVRTALDDIASARVYGSLGVTPATNPVPFNWYLPHTSSKEIKLFQRVIASTAPLAREAEQLPRHVDGVQLLYAKIMPRNLLHVLGEFYTPPWLAELLLEDAGWEPTKSLIDPYAGSGVFLVAALNRAKRHGSDPAEALKNVAAIDLNPVAYIAARTNLLFKAVSPGDTNRSVVRLPLLCADALLPCVLQHGPQTDLWDGHDASLMVDGVEMPISTSPDDLARLAQEVKNHLARSGHGLAEAIQVPATSGSGSAPRSISLDGPHEGRTRPISDRLLEHLAVLFLAPADVLLTNPPWVGWEYMSRPYRARLNPAWKRYSLYTAKGREAAFLKEDLSTLALVAAWDRYLRRGGTSAVVLRPASMQSHLAAKGLRRLSIHPDSEALRLRHVRDFDGLRPFANTAVTASAWVLEKGEPTDFPVPVKEWRSSRRGWQPDQSQSLQDVRKHVKETELAATRSNPNDAGSPWTIGSAQCHNATSVLLGSNDYKVRTGVFTGGANAVYYLDRLARTSSNACHWYRNVIERAKRSAPAVEVELEDGLVYEVVRGRDLSLWGSTPGAVILCPHTAETRMRAIPQQTLEKDYPKAFAYLSSMRDVLDARKGFSGWERHIREEAFYTIQRVGEYTFSPYKVAWRYIARDFIVAVTGPDERNRPRMCNDKVMYVPFDDDQEAYYFCGLLSSDPVRWCVVSTMTGTQISTSAIKHLNIPRYSAADVCHRAIAESCRRGHQAVAHGRKEAAEEELTRINNAVATLYGLSDGALRIIRAELSRG